MYSKSEIVFVICVFLFVSGCFSVPVLIYATSDYVNNPDFSSEQADIGIDIDNCPQQVSYVANYIANHNSLT